MVKSWSSVKTKRKLGRELGLASARAENPARAIRLLTFIVNVDYLHSAMGPNASGSAYFKCCILHNGNGWQRLADP